MLKNYVKLIFAIVFVSNVMAQNVPSYVPKDGLVGWWPFNGNANDESGNGNDGTVNGATLTEDRNRVANNAYSFDGEENVIILDTNILHEANVLTISCWFQTNDFTGRTKNIFNKRREHFGDGLYLWIMDKNCAAGLNREPEVIGQYHTVSNNISNEWQHGILQFSKGILSFYLNNKFIGSINSTDGPIIGNQKFYIGKGFDQDPDGNGNRAFNGKIDDIAIYNRALSDQEIKQLYEGCNKETATSNSFNSYAFTNNSSINLTATPTGGTFSGEAVTNNAFYPSIAKLGKNHVKYTFKNSTGCADSTNFEMILVDTLGNKCSTYDTLKIKVQLTTGIKSGQVATMNVYPNPTSNVVIIETSNVAALNGYSYKMVDLQGKQVYKELVTKSKTEISLKSIGAKGVYILHVVDAQGVSIENKKIVLE